MQWKDIRPWQPEFQPEEKHFVSANFAGFSLCILSKGSAKLRWVGRRVRRSSVGCSVAQKCAAQLKRRSLSRGCSVALRVQRSSQGAAQLSRVQRSSIGCSIAHQGAAQLIRVQCSSVRCNVAQYGAAQPSGKIYAPGGQSLGLKGSILFLEIVYFFWGGAAKLRQGGAQRPDLPCFWAQKDGCAQRTGAHARPKPTSYQITLYFLYIFADLKAKALETSKKVFVRLKKNFLCVLTGSCVSRHLKLCFFLFMAYSALFQDTVK